MERIIISKNDLKCFDLKRIIHCESSLYRYQDMVIKIFNDQSKNNILRKERLVTLLNEQKESLNLPELIIPNAFVKTDDNQNGLLSPFNEGTNAKIILSSKDIPLSKKIEVLRLMGSLINKLKKKGNIAIGDFYEDNFGYLNSKLVVYDTDSISLDDIINPASKYVQLNPNLKGLENKYPVNVYGVNEANLNSDILSFIMIILKVISNNELHILSYDEYMHYLDYLCKLGFDSNLLNSFAKIYSQDDNINPLPYLKENSFHFPLK